MTGAAHDETVVDVEEVDVEEVEQVDPAPAAVEEAAAAAVEEARDVERVTAAAGEVELLAASPAYQRLAVAWKLAQRLAPTEFVPKTLRGRPAAVLAAILSGEERGIGPMHALASIHVVDGKPTASAELMRALVLRAGHRIEIVETTRERCTLRGARADGTSSAEITWTLADAREAKLAGKDVWKNYPRAMLLARATSELCRAVFPDVIAGLSYTPEELGAVIDVDEVDR